MATVKKANVPPTHPTVWAGLGLATMGLLVAVYAYTGSRIYDIFFAFVATLGGLLALGGILVAAWGRSVMASRAQRSRRTTFSQDALAISKPESEPAGSETMPTIAAPSEKKRFSFSVPKRAEKKPKEAKPAASGSVFAFRRQEAPASRASDDPRNPAFVESPPSPTAESALPPVRATLKCPNCAHTFDVEGVRPFDAVCPACSFASTV